MIDPKAIPTYAQYNEDIILLALFDGVDKGFYVDVGANSPVTDSATKIFYDKGWSGINIEPIQKFYDQLQKDRPEDVNLCLGAGEKTGTATLREFVKLPGHSTFSDAEKKQHSSSSAYTDYQVPIKPLKDIFAEQKVERINFLKVDVEGFEHEVMAGNDWSKYRPEVVCIEANHEAKSWRAILTNNNYKLFIADGLNEYHIAKEAWDRTKDFAEKVIKLDYHTLKQHQYQSWSEDSQKLKRLSELAQKQQDQLDGLHAELKRVGQLSLVDQPLRIRLKRVIKGLTSDWWRYKKRAKK